MRSGFTQLVLLSSMAAFLAACGGEEAAAPQATAIPVSIKTVEATDVPLTLEIMAQTEGAKETEVRARVGGILLKRLYEEGHPVKEGQPLFQIDPEPYKIAYARAKASAEQTEREEKRLKGLVKSQAVSQKEYDDAYSANAVAQAALREAKLNLEWTTVTAPVSGVTGRSLKSEGSLVTVGTDSLLTSVYQNDPIWVRFGMSESDSAKLPGGRANDESIKSVELVLPNGNTYSEKGRINFLASTIDTTLGTQQLRAEFPNPNRELLPGQFVRIRLLSHVRENVFLVPQEAVSQTQSGYLLMLANAENKVEPRKVEVAEWVGTDWVITGGLKTGDRVITDNILKLKTGGAVIDRTVLAQQQAAQKAQQAQQAQQAQ